MASLWIHGIIFFVLLMQQSLILVAVASSNVSLSFVNYMCLLFCLIIDLVFLIILFGGFVYFYGFGRFALCIWERDSMMNLNSFKTRTMRCYQVYLEGFSSNF